MSKNLKWSIVLVFLVLFIDQLLKIWVKTHMLIGESSYVDWDWKIRWAQLLFVENRGMAFGMELPFNSGKFILTTLRLVVISFIGYYIYKNSKKALPLGFILTLSMIFSGALGNLIDSMFYGMIFEPSNYGDINPASFVGIGHGYASFMHGKVVDMFYFPMFTVNLPQFLGGGSFLFFEPVFNVADSMITVGVSILLIFGNKWFKLLQAIDEQKKVEKETSEINIQVDNKE
ncbi:MAG: lipoprotein signal peptidase [Bacteroidales bacterium]|nr:lipoprotein signal peptidase [Bacteroidales bacterium]